MNRISISGPDELLAVLPFHFGFQPTRSAVVACFHERRMGLVARLDLCPEAAASEATARIVPVLRAESPDHVVLVGYEQEAGESLALCDALEDALAGEHLELSDRLVVRGDRWYDLLCACCPDEGTALKAAADVPGVAGYVALGKTVLPGREALASLVAPRHDAPDSLGDAIREFGDELEWARRVRLDLPGESPSIGDTDGDDAEDDGAELRGVVERASAAWGRLLRGPSGGEQPAADLPALAGCLRDVDVRDGIIAWLCPGTLRLEQLDPVVAEALGRHLGPLPDRMGSGSRARFAEPSGSGGEPEDVQARLESLVREVPVEHATPLLSVVASFAWWCGDGARASVALEQALDLEPDHRLCALVRRMVALGIRDDRASA